MIKRITMLGMLLMAIVSCKNDKEVESTDIENGEEQVIASNEQEMPDLKISPISHATFVMEWNDLVFYVDPVGGASAFEGYPEADYVLVTDIHGDHFNQETLSAVVGNDTKLIIPQAVFDKMEGFNDVEILNNGQSFTKDGLTINAIPMYNLTEGRLDKHVKGRGNGYVIEANGYRAYISGDTEDIPEMRNLENIDLAFLCMNLPYTMDAKQAADATLEFQPKKVIPYHYRGTDGFQDVEGFKSQVESANSDIEVELREWYPERS